MATLAKAQGQRFSRRVWMRANASVGLVYGLGTGLGAGLASGCSRASSSLFFAASSLGPFLAALLALPQAQRIESPAPLLQLAGSQVLRAQIELGALPDLVFTANADALTSLERSGLVGPMTAFASTRLVVVLHSDFAPGIELDADVVTTKQLASLCGQGTRWVLAAQASPIGRYSQAALEEFGLRTCVEARIVSRDPSATASLGRIRSGDADVGISYSSLLALPDSREGLRVLELPATSLPAPRYFVAQRRGSARPRVAQAFLDLLASPDLAPLYEEFGMTRL